VKDAVITKPRYTPVSEGAAAPATLSPSNPAGREDPSPPALLPRDATYPTSSPDAHEGKQPAGEPAVAARAPAFNDGLRILVSSFSVTGALAWLALAPTGSGDVVPVIVAFGTGLYLLRGRRLVFVAIPLVLALALWGTGVATGLLEPSPVVGVELGLPALLALVAARRLRLERLAKEHSVSLLEARVNELREMSFRDPLTGLYNRRYATEAGRGFVAHSKRYGGDLHALMVDIDHFKRINDELGHARGDVVLKGIAGLVRMAIRETDIAARIGGEEFLMLLPKAGAEHAQNIANRVRDLVGTTAFEGVPWTVTVSLGVTGLRDGDDFDGLVDRADSFLYYSKRSGRNRVSGT
jgi:diguanylate cyclase (GGDEF)-like protein